VAKYRLAKRIADEIDDPAAAAAANRLLRAPYRR
jgi:hypothetical protein